jgi:toxin ParE1/3/4
VAAWDVHLTEAAERDFQSILAWTAEQFGQAQARRYRESLVSALAVLADGPDPLNWKSREDLALGLRSLHVGRRARHILFFRAGGEDVVEVLRILHEAMDPTRHFPSQEGGD